MTIPGVDLAILLSVVAIFAYLAGCFITKARCDLAAVRAGQSIPSDGGSDRPIIQVVLPKDAAPLAELTPLPPTQVVGPDRAVLWWTIFHEVTDRYTATLEEAIDSAAQAVLSVYGPVVKSPTTTHGLSTSASSIPAAQDPV